MKRESKMNLCFVTILAVLNVLIAEPYRGGELRTDQAFQYGRFETRMKAAPGSGVVNSFFLYRDYWAEGLSGAQHWNCLLYTSPSPRDATLSRMPSSA